MNKRLNILIGALALMITSCMNWLDVKPEDRMTDEQLYGTEAGFRIALNGVYVEMNKKEIYGGEMLVGSLEVLAQRYNVSGTSYANYTDLAVYDYTTDLAKAPMEKIWIKLYSLIANCNKSLEYAEKNNHVFKGDSEHIIKGELLALRAFLHFDLLRIFGPVYSVNPNAASICYNIKYSISATDLLPASEVIAKITEDLKNAETYLEKDPIITKGPQLAGSADGLNIETYRTQRLNYYAVKALLARVYLYAGENESACNKAREVIAVQEKWFPFTKKENIVGGRDKDDRVFSSELLFCLSNTLRGEIFNDYFNFDRNAEEVLSPKKDLERFFIRYAANDYRYISSWVSVPNSDYKSFCKYEGSEGSAYYKTLIPMIRISEMYYIVAEASSDVEEAKEALNKVLYNRGQELLTPEENYKTIVADEYVREFWGEGQLFFYYKRVNQSKIYSLALKSDLEMSSQEYVIPLPKVESDYR